MSALNFECTICVLLQCYRLLVVFSPLLQNYHLICDTHFNTIVIDKVNWNNNLELDVVEICPLIDNWWEHFPVHYIKVKIWK